mmetsp:Transcript_8692/g.16405  ORF Transcript_8692/g.16405 Transcript_8692/m.16405 type:complete len:560 (+) Transcript_8692:32-1711(+)
MNVNKLQMIILLILCQLSFHLCLVPFIPSQSRRRRRKNYFLATSNDHTRLTEELRRRVVVLHHATTTTSGGGIPEAKAAVASSQHKEHSLVLLAKTRESFKLSDLYFLQAKLLAQSRNWTETKLVSMDRNTGSYLLQLDSRFVVVDDDDDVVVVAGSSMQHQTIKTSSIQQQQSSSCSCLLRNRLDWMAYGLVFGTSGHELVKNILSHPKYHASTATTDADTTDTTTTTTDTSQVFLGTPISNAVTLDYLCMGHLPQKDYTPKNLLCRISQTIPVPVALVVGGDHHHQHKGEEEEEEDKDEILVDNHTPTDLIVIETPHGVYLAHRVNGIWLSKHYSSSSSSTSASSSKSNKKKNDKLLVAEDNKNNNNKKSDSSSSFLKRWAGRPFQYSSAVNPMVANILVDLLFDLTVQNHHRSCPRGVADGEDADMNAAVAGDEKDRRRIKMLDPTVGSGTFLAFAIKHGMDVMGYDIQPKCVEGTIQNLNYLFHPARHMDSLEDILLCGQIRVGDSTIGKNHSEGAATFDCAMTNLPWGQNTKMKNKDDNFVSAMFEFFSFECVL